MAALIALIGLPLMLSGSATWLIKMAFNRTQRQLRSHGSTCERLEWQDIPDGELRRGEEDLNPLKAIKKDVSYFSHSDTDCLGSTYGNVFQCAWTSAQRRDRRVFKPYQLNASKHYVRTDRKTLEAFLLLSHTSRIQFLNVDGILTAHLPLYPGGQQHSRTKHEVEKILQGYPPFYLQRIKVTDTTTVSSPISSAKDITRGGWIVGVGLDSDRTPPLSTHNMESGFSPPRGWSAHVRSPFSFREDEPSPWMSTGMVYSVNRFGEVLSKLLVQFPDNEAVRTAVRFYEDLTTGKTDPGPLSYPFDIMQGYPVFRELVYIDSELDPFLQTPMRPTNSYGSKLSKDQWELAMSAFNHRSPLTQSELELFRDFMLPILLAGLVGLTRVFLLGHYRSPSRDYRRLQDLPELLGRKYVYLTACEPEEGD
ncbi:hypothetical protein PFICI_03233 [Pestalotiopsis fici W106-1]|uniref:Uncharacterized protein n=1 Tax=Pestalotiopsis fici (strain W106-1 / CGMCC3.15140) TaxID=1229662 RepID=W3XGJ5_PESFW|nr:uncharacterized protein PFICI_03233 [Pestalotiopsis fici W106-1]ETS85208.1 hypothetical protein PFICI_03233 [Pestalotiopsis fici W106-1]